MTPIDDYLHDITRWYSDAMRKAKYFDSHDAFITLYLVPPAAISQDDNRDAFAAPIERDTLPHCSASATSFAPHTAWTHMLKNARALIHAASPVR